MGRAAVEDTQAGFTGLNTSAEPAHLGPSEVTRAVNAKFTLSGGVTPRLGSQRVHSTPLAGPIQAMTIWQNAPGQAAQLVVIAGSQLYTARILGAPPWTFTAIGACSQALMPSIVAFADSGGGDCVYIGDISTMWRWDGTALTNLAPPAGVPALAVQNRRLFGIATGGWDGAPGTQTLYWSSLDSGDDLGVATVPGAGGAAVIRTFGESYLSALCAFGPGLLLGHKFGISTFTGWGQSDISIQSGTEGVSADTGVWNSHGMTQIEAFGIIVSERGAYVLDPSGLLTNISRPLQTIWKQPSHGDPLGYVVANFPQSGWVAHDDVQRCVYVLGGTTAGNTALYTYNYGNPTPGWSGPWAYNWIANGATIPITCLAVGRTGFGGSYFASAPTHVVLAGGSDGYIRRLEVDGLGLDDVSVAGTGGTPYRMRVTTRPLFGQDPQSGAQLADREKAWRWVDVQAQLVNPSSSQIAVSTYPTEGAVSSVPTVAPSYNNQPDTSPRTYRVHTGGRGQAIVVEIVDTPVNNPTGQNTYTEIRALGFDYGRRFA